MSHCVDCQCARVSMVTLTLSRYILESSLLDYSFVGRRESLMAAACLLLAMCMNNDGVWVCLCRIHTNTIYYSNIIDTITHTHTHTHHTTVLRPSWILSGATRVSWHQKGKTNLDLLEQEIVSSRLAVASAWSYANLHLDLDFVWGYPGQLAPER